MQSAFQPEPAPAHHALPPRADAAGGVFHYASTDVHDYCANLQGWHLTYDQLSRGAFHGSLTARRLSRIEVFHEVTTRTLRQCGTLGADSFTIGVPWCDTAVARCNGTTVTGPDAFVMSLNAEIEFITPDDYELRGLSVSARMMQELAAAMQVDWPSRYASRMLGARAEPGRLARLKNLLIQAQVAVCAGPGPGLDVNSIAARGMEDDLLAEVLELAVTSAPSGPVAAPARKRTVDRACDLMLSPDGPSMTLLDVCRAVGASPRKLTYCFREQLGISPGVYWKVIRLNRARKELLCGADADRDIYSVAARHGFWHFSQFSQDYKRHFAERPSETVRRARQRLPAGA